MKLQLIDNEILLRRGELAPIKLPTNKTLLEHMEELPVDQELAVPQVSNRLVERALKNPNSVISKAVVFAVAFYIERLYINKLLRAYWRKQGYKERRAALINIMERKWVIGKIFEEISSQMHRSKPLNTQESMGTLKVYQSDLEGRVANHSNEWIGLRKDAADEMLDDMTGNNIIEFENDAHRAQFREQLMEKLVPLNKVVEQLDKANEAAKAAAKESGGEALLIAKPDIRLCNQAAINCHLNLAQQLATHQEGEEVTGAKLLKYVKECNALHKPIMNYAAASVLQQNRQQGEVKELQAVNDTLAQYEKTAQVTKAKPKQEGGETPRPGA